MLLFIKNILLCFVFKDLNDISKIDADVTGGFWWMVIYIYVTSNMHTYC